MKPIDQKAGKMTTEDNLRNEHLKNIDRGLTFEASGKKESGTNCSITGAETEEDERPESKTRIKRHPNRKRTLRPSKNQKERIRLATA